jgi:hypothetical protein
MILQRYTFGSKSQPSVWKWIIRKVAYDIAKIYIWKQITTSTFFLHFFKKLLMILQRYTFGSKSQQEFTQAIQIKVAYDIAKIYIWKQITTCPAIALPNSELFMILQRYTFGSKSQRLWERKATQRSCL